MPDPKEKTLYELYSKAARKLCNGFVLYSYMTTAEWNKATNVIASYNGQRNQKRIEWKKDEPKDSNFIVKSGKSGRLVCSDPVQKMYAEIAIERVKRFLSQIKNFPYTLGLGKDFLIVDSSEKFSRVEMRVDQRLQQLEQAMGICNEQNRSILADFFTGVSKAVQGLLNNPQVQAYCQDIRLYRVSAMLDPNEDNSNELEYLTNQMEQDASNNVPEIGVINSILTLMEQVAGLAKGPVKPGSIENLIYDVAKLEGGEVIRQFLVKNKESFYSVPTGENVPRQIPQTLEIEVPTQAEAYKEAHKRVVNIRLQEECSKPENLGKSLDDVSKVFTQPSETDCMRQYVHGEIFNKLTALFSPVELMEEGPRSLDGFNRGTLIIVGDKTMGELMQEAYKTHHNEALKDENAFRKWYHENLNQLSAQFVFDAMMAGKPVKAHVPQSDGKLCAVPLKFSYSAKALFQVTEQPLAKPEKPIRQPLKRPPTPTEPIRQPSKDLNKSSNELSRPSEKFNEAILDSGKSFLRASVQPAKPSEPSLPLLNRLLGQTPLESQRPLLGDDYQRKAREAAQRQAQEEAQWKKQLKEWKNSEAGRLAADARLNANIKVIEAKRLDPNGTFVSNLFLNERAKPSAQEGMVATDPLMLSFCIGMILASEEGKSAGVTIADIVNPAKLQDTRTAAANEYLKYASDFKWLGEKMFYVQSALLKQINKITNGKNMNDPKDRDAVFSQIYPLGRALGEMNKYLEKHEKVKMYYAKALDTNANEMQKQVQNVTTLCDLMYRSASFQAKMSRPLLFNNTEQAEQAKQDMSDGLAAQLVEAYVFQAYEFDLKKPFSKQCPPATKIKKLETKIKNNKVNLENAERLACGWKDWKKGADYVVSGEIAEGVIWYDIDTNSQNELQEGRTFVYPTKLTAKLKEITNSPSQTNSVFMGSIFH